MPRTLLERGARFNRSKLPKAAAVTVEIRAGTEAIESIQAIPGRHNFQQYIVEDAAGTAEPFDWIVAEQDLVFPIAGKIQPAADWQVRRPLDDGRIAVFVVRPAAGTREFDVVDQLGLMYRIHTKFDRYE
jgi:hypothetical protein